MTKENHILKRNCRCLRRFNSTKRLYKDNERDDFEHEISEDRRISQNTTEELQNAIDKLKKDKSLDSNGIRVEDIKACDDDERNGETTLPTRS